MHKLHYIGSSGVTFSDCDRVWGNRLTAQCTEDDTKVTCETCLKIITRPKKITLDTSNTAK